MGTVKRIIISNVVSYNSAARLGGAGIIAGLVDHPIEDIKIHDLYMDHRGEGTAEMAARVPAEQEKTYPEPTMFGDIPANGFYVRNVKNIEFSNIEIAWSQPDARPVFSLNNVDGAEFFRIKTPKGLSTPVFALNKVADFRVTASRNVPDTQLENADQKNL